MSNTTGSDDTVREDDQRPLKKLRRDSNNILPKPESGTSSEAAVFDATTEAEGGDIEDEKKDLKEDESFEEVDEEEETEEEEDRGRRRGRDASASRTKSREHSHSKSRSRSHKGEEHERRTVTKIVEGKEVRQHISRDRYHSRSVSNNQQTKSSTDRSGHTSTKKEGSQRKDEQSHSRERVRVSMSPDKRSGEGDTLEYEKDSNGNVTVSTESEHDITPEDVDRGKTIDESSYGYEKCDEREASRSRSRSREGSRDRQRNRSRERNRGFERSVDVNGDGKDGRKEKDRSRESDGSTSATTVSRWSEDSNGDRRSESRTVVKNNSGEESRTRTENKVEKNHKDDKEEDNEDTYSVIATNLPGSATAAHVREIFERIGAVRNVDSMELGYRFRRRINSYEHSDHGSENNYMVTFHNKDDASDAVYRMNGSQVDHQVIGVTLYDKEKRADFKRYPKERTEMSKQRTYDTGWVSRGERSERSLSRDRSYSRDGRDRSYSRDGRRRSYSRERSYSQDRSCSRDRYRDGDRSYSRDRSCDRSYSQDGRYREDDRGRSYSVDSRSNARDRDRSYSRDRSHSRSRSRSEEKSYTETNSSQMSPRTTRPQRRYRSRTRSDARYRDRSQSPRRNYCRSPRRLASRSRSR